MISCLAVLHTETPSKGVNSKRKEFAPCGSKFFPFRVDPFSKGVEANNFPPLKVYQFSLKDIEYATVHHTARSLSRQHRHPEEYFYFLTKTYES